MSAPGDETDAAASSERGLPEHSQYGDLIRAADHDPQRLETLYQQAREAGAAEQFRTDMLACSRESPENLLYAAWFYRLQATDHDERRARLGGHWKVAVPLSVALGLVLWLLSEPRWMVAHGIPYLAVLVGPVTAAFIIGFVVVAGRQAYVRSALLIAALAAATGYALLITPRGGADAQQAYLTLMLAHLPLLAVAAIGICVLGWRSSGHERFAFLTKAIETIGTAGVAVIAGGIFVAITTGMFQALSITIPNLYMRLLIAGGAGLIPVLSVAAVYDPSLRPDDQEFGRGFGRILTVLMWALLPLTLIVLIMYVCVIPFNFMAPFTNRDVLFVYNVMLFAIMVLLLGVTPVTASAVPARYQRWLRMGIIAVAALAALIGVYALAAVAYRAAHGILTMNRLTVIGWNTVNLVVLGALLYEQIRRGRKDWVNGMDSAFRLGTTLYVAWGLIAVLVWPWLF
ncbi:MAG TPA: hypothetical protein VF818_07465 [Ktedonobacterales bacterium]